MSDACVPIFAAVVVGSQESGLTVDLFKQREQGV
jgi:hypothetical protein